MQKYYKFGCLLKDIFQGNNYLKITANKYDIDIKVEHIAPQYKLVLTMNGKIAAIYYIPHGGPPGGGCHLIIIPIC